VDSHKIYIIVPVEIWEIVCLLLSFSNKQRPKYGNTIFSESPKYYGLDEAEIIIVQLSLIF
jgi:hypothetical protein